MQVFLRNFRRAAGASEKLRSVDRPCRAPHRLSLSFASTEAHRSAEIALALACSVDAMKAQEHVHRGVSRRPCATPLRITSSPRVWALCLSFRARSRLVRNHAYRTHALSALRHALSLRPLTLRPLPSHLACAHPCPLCSQTRPHAPSFALSPRMRAPVPSLLSDTPSHYALSLRPLTLSFALFHHACMPSHALLRPLTSHARTRALSTALRHALSTLRPLTLSFRALSPRMHALSRPLTPCSHLACMPSNALSSRMHALSCPARMAVCMPFHALSQISLPSCLVSNIIWIGFDLWCPLLALATNIPHTRSRRRMLACAAHPKKACPATEGGQGPSFVRYAKSYAEVSL